MSSNAKTKVIAGIEWNVTYMIVWAALVGLTVIEVFIPEIAVSPTDPEGKAMLSRNAGVILLIALAVAKTFCVAWYYMHLIDERPLITLIASAPFIFSVFLTIGLFPW